MDKAEYKNAIMDVAYLCACAVNGQIPDATRVSGMNIDHLYSAADRNLLTGITAMALESAGVKDPAFTQAKGKAIRKVAAFDLEREAILDAFEKAGIWYLPLKGAVLKDLYPMIGMRQMADNDILCDASRTADVRAIMESHGFETDKAYGHGAHDSFFKPPVYNFEMHRTLFSANHDKRIRSYYENVKGRLKCVDGKEFERRFSDEDFYVYMIAHEYKHYSGGGTGLRSLLDTYVYILNKGKTLDWDYISGEIEKLGITDFESKNRSLALHLFCGDALSCEDQSMLDYVISSGTYGTVENRVNNGIAKKGDGIIGKVRYVFSRIFLPLDVVRSSFPLFIKYPVLLPFLPFYRAIRGVTTRRNVMKAELKTIAGYKQKKDRENK